MDLLETILRSCDADKYVNNFKENGIETYILKILVDEDLEAIGVEDAELRAKILNHCKNLQIPTEKKRDLTVDNQYLSLVLSQINVQITKHFANLTYALRRRNVDLCYIKVRPAALCLEGCLNSLDEQLDHLERRVLMKEAMKRKKGPVLMIGTIGAAAVAMFVFVKYFKWASSG